MRNDYGGDMELLGRIFDFVERMVEHILAFIVVRLIYFVGGILAAYMLPPVFVPDATGLLLLGPYFHIFALGFAILCGVFGPWVYQRYTTRGRGDLAAIREASAMESAADWQRVADNTSFETWREGIDQEQGAGRPEHRAQGVARNKSPQ